MSKYKIERWDSAILEKNTYPYPVIYIKPSKDMKSQELYTLKIEGTGGDYQGKEISGILYSSAYFPSYRPNFYNATGWYIFVLLTNWNGYPKKDGYVIVNEIKPDILQEIETDKGIVEKATDEEQKHPNLSFAIIIIFIALIFFVLKSMS